MRVTPCPGGRHLLPPFFLTEAVVPKQLLTGWFSVIATYNPVTHLLGALRSSSSPISREAPVPPQITPRSRCDHCPTTVTIVSRLQFPSVFVIHSGFGAVEERTRGRGRVTALTRGGVPVVPSRATGNPYLGAPSPRRPDPPSIAVSAVAPQPKPRRRTAGSSFRGAPIVGSATWARVVPVLPIAARTLAPVSSLLPSFLLSPLLNERKFTNDSQST